MFLSDEFFVKLFGTVPALSPNRYAGLDQLAKYLKPYPGKTLSILDVGSGSHLTADFLGRLGIVGKYLGIDIKFKQAVSGSTDFGKLKAKYQEIDFYNLKHQRRFDLILSLWNLEHMRQDTRALSQMKHLLKRQGSIILLIPSAWTWPVEFGRHGYHYYSTERINLMANAASLSVTRIIRIGGLTGLLFSMIYQWLSYAVLLPALLAIKVLGGLPSRHTRADIGNAKLSRWILRNSIFAYKRTRLGRQVHFQLVKLLSLIDHQTNLTPLSYLVVLTK